MHLHKQTTKIEPLKFISYNGNYIDFKNNKNFKSFHLVSSERKYAFENITDFLKRKFITNNKINNNVIYEENLINVSRKKYNYGSITTYQKEILITSGIFNNGEKNSDAIIIHSPQEKDEYLTDIVDAMSQDLPIRSHGLIIIDNKE